MENYLSHIWNDLVARVSGPLSLRLFMQPTMATIFAIRDGLKDAKTGQPPYFFGIFTDPEHRRAMLIDGWQAVAKIFILAMLLDVVFQLIVFRWIYPVEVALVAFLLAFNPYLVVRGIANRIARSFRRKLAQKISILIIGALCVLPSATRAQTSSSHSQTPTSSPTVTSTTATISTQKDETTSDTAEPKAGAETADASNPWHRETMTGDWGGVRSRWKEKGVELEFKSVSFYQQIASGGINDHGFFTGKLETTWKFDLGKVAGWKYWSSEIKAEWRFGGPVLTGTGGINIVNTAGIIPAAAGSVVSVTAVNFTRIIPRDLKKGNMYVVSFGRYNLVDLLDEDFFAGGGTERFLNVAPIGPLTVLRQVPLVTNAATFATVKGGEPRFSFTVMDPNDQSLDPGLDTLFADGITFSPAYNIPTKYFGKTAKHTFSGAITTKKYTPFDAIKQVIIPGPPLNPVEPKRGSFSVSYSFRQYLVERAHRDGWGLFTQLSFADKDTSPITRFFNVGLGGNGLIASRRQDEFGISYAYTDLSKVLKDNLNLISLGLLRPRPEHQFEGFYNIHITPWLRLTGDLQIIRGVRRRVDTAVVPGARLEMIF